MPLWLAGGAALGGAISGLLGSRRSKKNAANAMRQQERMAAEQQSNLDLSAQAAASGAAAERGLNERRAALADSMDRLQIGTSGPDVDLNVDEGVQRARRRGFADPFSLE